MFCASENRHANSNMQRLNFGTKHRHATFASSLHELCPLCGVRGYRKARYYRRRRTGILGYPAEVRWWWKGIFWGYSRNFFHSDSLFSPGQKARPSSLQQGAQTFSALSSVMARFALAGLAARSFAVTRSSVMYILGNSGPAGVGGAAPSPSSPKGTSFMG